MALHSGVKDGMHEPVRLSDHATKIMPRRWVIEGAVEHLLALSRTRVELVLTCSLVDEQRICISWTPVHNRTTQRVLFHGRAKGDPLWHEGRRTYMYL